MRGDIKDAINFISKEELNMYNKAELARRFNCDPRTIDRYIKIQSGEITPNPSSRIYKSKLDGYKEIILEKVDKYGCSAMAIYKFIVKKGYAGKYSTVASFVKDHKDNEKKKATIRFETNPGLQAQVDWKEDMSLVSRTGEIFKFNIFLIVLGYSRYKYIAITSDRTQDTLLKCLSEAFIHFDGVPREILFDNMKTVIDRSKSSFTKAVLNQRFEYYAKDIGFNPIACRPYRPQTKGKVESLAKLMDRLKAYNEEFENWTELCTICRNFMDDINAEISQGSLRVPSTELEKEREYFLPLPKASILEKYVSHHEEKTYLVNRESMIRFEGKKYSVPTRFIGMRMTVKRDDLNLSIYYMGELVICHAISTKPINYTLDTAVEILKSDAMKHKSDSDIIEFAKHSLLEMDKFTGEK